MDHKLITEYHNHSMDHKLITEYHNHEIRNYFEKKYIKGSIEVPPLQLVWYKTVTRDFCEL